jgi:hypothetical protein
MKRLRKQINLIFKAENREFLKVWGNSGEIKKLPY